MEKISSGCETMSENWSCLSTCFSVDHCIHVRFSLEKKNVVMLYWALKQCTLNTSLAAHILSNHR